MLVDNNVRKSSPAPRPVQDLDIKQFTDIPPPLAAFFGALFKQAVPQATWERYRQAVDTLARYKDKNWKDLNDADKTQAQSAIKQADACYDEIFQKYRDALDALNSNTRNDNN